MKELSLNAKECLDSYLKKVKARLRGAKSLDGKEIERDIQEHIERELESEAEPVGHEAVAGVLDRLGSPEQWVPDEELNWWRKVLMRLSSGPEDWRLTYISFGLFVLAFFQLRIGMFIFIPLSFIVARGTLSMIDDPGQLKGRRWLIYPSLFIVYIFAAFWLLLWPIYVLQGIANGIEHFDSERFPWNTGNEMSFWLIVIVLIGAGTALWWLVLVFVHKKKARILRVAFHPFVGHVKPSWTNWFMGISLLLLVLCSAGGFLMIKFHGWFYWLKEVFR